MSTRTSTLRPSTRLEPWGDSDLNSARPRASGAPAERPTTLLVVMAATALAVAVLVARLVDGQVTGEFAAAFRTLWWLMLAFNVVDAFVQRSRLEAWNTLLLKYVMVGVTYSILV